MMHPFFYFLARNKLHDALGAEKGVGFFKLNRMMRRLTDEQLDSAVSHTATEIPAAITAEPLADGSVGAIGDGSIIKAIKEWFAGPDGQSLIAALVKWFLALLGA